MSKSTVIHGDCLTELKKIPDKSIDLIFADPPYWMQTTGFLQRFEGIPFSGCDDDWDKFSSLEEYKIFSYTWLQECKRVLKKDGSIWVIGSLQCIYCLGSLMQEMGFWFINDVIWYKKNPTPNFRGNRLNNAHEILIWATPNKSSHYTFNYKTAKELNLDTISLSDYTQGKRKQLSSIWKIAVCQGKERLKDSTGKKLHNTQKPIELLYRILAINSKIDDTILDCFGGTMTTGAASKMMGRNFIGIEKNKIYCDYGKERIANTLPQIGPIERADFDISPLRISLKSLIEKKILTAFETLYLKGSDKTAILQPNGHISFKDKIFDIHEGSATALNLKVSRLNGYLYWFVLRNKEKISLFQIRENYRKTLSH